MSKEKVKKIELNEKERKYLSGLIEAQRSKIDFLPENQKEKEPIRNDLKIANSIGRKLAHN